MRKVLFAVLAICLMSISSYAQTGFNYKALIKDTNGNVLSNQEIDIRFTIQTLEGPVFIASYQELHLTTTDSNGIAIVTIGEGEIITGSFPDNFWLPNITLNTEIDIERDGTFVDFGESNFKKVPMATHADNVFSGDYNDLINQPTIVEPFGLEAIDEGSGIGWRLIGQNPDNYGSVGNGAVDLSQSPNSATNGATGEYSIAMGNQTGASGDNSTAMGFGTSASGDNSTALGKNTFASSENSVAIGWLNVDVPDALFMIGNGSAEGGFTTSNALTVLKNGNVIAGGPFTIENATDATSLWRLETRPNGGLSMYRNGNYRGFFSEFTGNYSSISDRSTKKDITAIENGTLSKVMQLNPVSYLMKDQTDTKRNLGLISQEVQEIFPSITTYVEESDLITLSYTELIPILIKALQEQQGVINTQNSKIETLSTDNSTLENMVNNLISRVEKIETNNQ
ncbi:tail fiber domain-containing protein [Winogradskyella costae]|uniref:tail fiber domain-containing protein n=1 Tax=Winogradskyella costae TaxID=2697008 RepID=UPI001C53F926|nr:tail fiber domain-containing protein [Winogradskyella costae]